MFPCYYRGAEYFVVVWIVLADLCLSHYIYEEELLYADFPANFRWGVSTAAYQVSTRNILFFGAPH